MAEGHHFVVPPLDITQAPIANVVQILPDGMMISSQHGFKGWKGTGKRKRDARYDEPDPAGYDIVHPHQPHTGQTQSSSSDGTSWNTNQWREGSWSHNDNRWINDPHSEQTERRWRNSGQS